MLDNLNTNIGGELVDKSQIAPSRRLGVKIRDFPYPYKAALSICSDIDETKSTEEFLEIQRFLNTKKMTDMGEGVGLEVGNSFYFYNNEHQFSFFTHNDNAKEVIIDLIRAGYIDCLHTYGDTDPKRDVILRALENLYAANCKIDVWINHYGSSNNLSKKFEYMFDKCLGDDPNSDVYHADETLNYGIKFIWVGATSRLIGQLFTEPTYPLAAFFDKRRYPNSALNWLKEIRKGILGILGDERFILHTKNKLLQPLELSDGQKVYEFMRHCNHPVSIAEGATSHGLAYVISKRALNHLKKIRGFMIVYTHFGKNENCRQVIAADTQKALRNLEEEYRLGNIYVTTTSRLLNYYYAHEYLVWSVKRDRGHLQIDIESIQDPVYGNQHPQLSKLQGITFYVPECRKTDISIQGKKIPGILSNSSDETGFESVTIPLSPLIYPY